ncbi:hypothetical protein [Buttiauxella brennerae]|uniref:hypothetical protein n=1 Tax=Buttiauxella brennerae TaxID=82988 RepID=UPI00286ED06A|nr:hypothetical protein [Buttiauxella brennerae]
MVIKVDSKGNAKVAKWELRQIACDAGFRQAAAKEYREQRQTDYGLGVHGRYYRRACLDDYFGHLQFEGNYHDARKDPPQILMPCRCCYAEWLIFADELKEAIAAIRIAGDNE